MACKLVITFYNVVVLLSFGAVFRHDVSKVFLSPDTLEPNTRAFIKFAELCARRYRAAEFFSCAVLMATTGYLNLDRASISLCSPLYRACAMTTMIAALESILLCSAYVSHLNATALNATLVSAWMTDTEFARSPRLFDVPSMLALAPALSIWSGVGFICFRLAYMINKTSGEAATLCDNNIGSATSVLLAALLTMSFLLTAGTMRRFAKLGSARANKL